MILVTGGGGMIGAVLAASLAARGEPVLATSHRPAIGGWRLDLRALEPGTVPEGVTVAVLCGWQGGVNECASDPSGTAAINVDGNLGLIARLRAAGARIIFLSTSLVFSAPPTASGSPLSPCCEYARQKASVEAGLDPSRDAVVRVTKVAETLLPRLRGWAAELSAGRKVRVSPELRVAPVRLAAVVAGLASLAADFQPGIFQMSASRDASYREVGLELAGRLGAAPDLLLNAALEGTLFAPVPTTGRLDISAPPGCREWPDGTDAMQSLVEQAIS